VNLQVGIRQDIQLHNDLAPVTPRHLSDNGLMLAAVVVICVMIIVSSFIYKCMLCWKLFVQGCHDLERLDLEDCSYV